MSTEIPFLVQTSSNLGHVVLDGGTLETAAMVRSNVDSGKADVVCGFRRLTELLRGEMELSNDYPAWEYRQDSPLRETMARVYEQMYGVRPQINAIHAGLECGILTEKLSGADMASIGPNLKNVHSPDERLDIKSVQRCWEYLQRVLKELK